MNYSFFKNLEKPKEKLNNEVLIKKELANLLNRSVRNSVYGVDILPIAFSGGLDSSILAYLASKFTKSILFCVGFKNSYDVANAQKSAKLLNKDLEIIFLDNIDLRQYRNKVIDIIKTKDRLQLELGLPLLILCEKLKAKRYKYFMTGQGADTLFGGFDRYLRSKNLENDILKAVQNIYETNLKRDLAIGKFYGIELLFPFLEEEFVKFVLKIPGDFKIKEGVKKYILREAFHEILPREILEQNKKALQYGSGVHKAFKHLNN